MKAKKEGGYVLYQELQKIDPVAATKIMPTNLRRIIRALEIYQKTGHHVSQLWQKQPPPYPILGIGLTMQRDNLYRRIDSRVDEMIKQGLIDEVKDLVAKGYSPDLSSMSGIGYKQISMFIEGKLDLPTAIQKMKNETHRFARHQYAWFHLDEARINWLNEYNDIHKETANLLTAFLTGLHNKQVNNEVH
jgi:tRNA dimethylallyltransferase